ncbi:MAG: hypothetical protein ABI091_20340, partial [Ferruginibacter sp.]
MQTLLSDNQTPKKQNEIKQEKGTTKSNPNYDKELADKLGGDDYGMKSYFFVILKTGANTTTDKKLITKVSTSIWATSTNWLKMANSSLRDLSERT